MVTKFVLITSAVFWMASAVLHADDALLEQLYGSGVHAYNQGDYLGAYDSLNSAIKGGTNDPRAYYFRGLAYLKLGRDPEAKADFQAGAELEAGDSADVYPVNRSLERVQGRSRQLLEQYRTTVHAAAVQRKEAEHQARYEERAAAEQDVLRQVAPTELPSGVTGQPNSSPDGSGEMPAKSNKLLDKSSPEPDKNPFEQEPSKSAPKSTPGNSDNPFGGSEPLPQKTSTPTPAANDDPFGNPQPLPPAKPATGAMPVPAGHTHDRVVQPTAHGLSSLMHAVVQGSKGDQVAPPASAGSPLPDILQGIFGHGSASTSGVNTTLPPAQPSVGVAGSPPTQNTNPPGETSPPATTPATPLQGGAATGTPTLGGEQPAAQPTPPAGTPPPNNPAPPPKDNDNPFN
ncbi:MAG TPA: hypothetical protein VMJ32_17070 [Pirellulales bacterium]|nr:hypothetical protein [Pirellulales bacterium]